MDLVVRKMMLTLALCVGLTLAEPPVLSGQYGVPGNFAGSHGAQQQQQQYAPALTNSYGAPLGDFGGAGHGGHGGHGGGGGGGGHDEHQDYIDSQPKSYEFGYAVKDANTGNDYGRRETSDGETVRGEYRVQLPDGRTQIVSYTADWRTGFHADVRYEGVAQYPDQYNQGYNANANNQGYDYPANNNIDSGFNAGNHGGHNNYQGGASNGFGGGSGGNNYLHGSNSIDGGYSGGSSFTPPPPPPPSSQYGSPSPSSQYGAPSPSSQYGAPPSSQYGAPPSAQYGAPASSPSSQYGAPPSSQYGAPPSAQYGVPFHR